MKKLKKAVVLAAEIIKKSGLIDCPTTKEISKKVNLNEYYLKIQFRKKFGCSLYKYFLLQRMEAAKKILRTTDEPLKNIYKQVGYIRMTAFITMFKRYVGMTPAAYRLQKEVKEIKKFTHAELEKIVGHEFEYIYQ